MKNEIFISYANVAPDRQLAEKLYNALNSPYFPVFFDKDRLDLGTSWDEQLRQNLVDSKHLVVIWSSAAVSRQWVAREIAVFRELHRAQAGLIIPVCLDINPDVFVEQAVMILKESGVYPNGIAELDENLFNSVVNRIRVGIYKHANSQPIKRAVFTLTSARLQQIKNNNPGLSYPDTDSYGANFSDWKPYGSDRSIENIMDEFLYVHINQNSKDISTLYHWEDIGWRKEDENLWSEKADSLDTFDRETKALADQLCVMILDPFALNDRLIQERFQWCYDKCFMNPKALTMSLTYALAIHFTSLRNQLRRNAKKFYDNYCDPPLINNSILANGYTNMFDSIEIKRQLQITLRGQTRADSTGKNAFTQFS